MGALSFGLFVLFHPEPILFIIPLLLGFVLPEVWLYRRIKNRQAAVLRDLPHIIDLLNICVGAGLDFMVAVNRVIQEFRPCVVLGELKILFQEIQMGSSRREALKNLGSRVNSPEVLSFVRTLIQADRMGTPIGDALKMQSEEIRIRRFQKGEEMALKAPIKLLFPLLFFILPVVLIIVAGPILLQFTRGGAKGLMQF
jgi:tight adherence protein C